MGMEDAALAAAILSTGHAELCEIDPTGSPVGPTIRLLFTAPFLGQDLNTGMFANTKPQAHARAADLASVVPEVTVLRILGQDFTAQRIEAVEGSPVWKLLILNEV
jgi:hypothetical protein